MYHHYFQHSFQRAHQDRQFTGLTGQIITIPKTVILPDGRMLPNGTRVFIHSVSFTQAGQEMVTIVFPLNIGGNCIVGSAQVAASQLIAGPSGGVQTFR